MGLLERERELARLRRAMGDSARSGQVVAVTGEAGAGKTSLLRAATSTPTGGRVVRGLCDPLTTPRPLGPVRDILAELGVDQPPGTPGRGDVEALLVTAVSTWPTGSTGPTTVVVEDVQWIDEASVEALRFLVRRIDALPVLLVLTYRDVEIGTTHPLRPLLGDLARLENSDLIALPPLSVDAVGVLLDGTGLDAGGVHRLTGGNPFYVSEIGRHAGSGLPASVRDAVLAGTSELADDDLEVLQLVATAPDGIDDRLLPLLGVDAACLRRLDATGLLVRSRRGIGFRHELARRAVRTSIPLGAESGLHRRLLDALERVRSSDHAVLTHHADAAHDRSRTSRYAALAAEDAARAGSHTEAVAFLTLALDRGDDESAARARMLEALGQEQYMVSRLPEAIGSITDAIRLWERVGDVRGMAAAHDRGAIIEYYSARRREAEQHARLAVARDDTAAFASACATQAYLAYRRHDHQTADAISRLAREVAARRGDDAVGLRCDIIEDASELLRGTLNARGRLLMHAAVALERSFDEVGTTAYSNLSAIDIEHRRFREAEGVLDQSIPITVERDIPVCNQWQIGMRARLHFQRARWAAALEDADAVIDGQGMPLAMMWPHLVRGLVALRTGEAPAGRSATEHLDAAWIVAQRLDEPLAHLPVLSALAEGSWLTGEPDSRLDAATATLDDVVGLSGVQWAVGDLLVWLARIGRDAGSEALRDGVAEPFRLELAGRHDAAAAAWTELGAPYEAALAAVHGDDETRAARAVWDLERLPAAASATRARAVLRERGLNAVPPRRRASTRANPSGLTNRQLDVARLVARGLTNAELARDLFISPKTVDHHVSAVLGRLGLRTRREIVRRAAELGLD
ncbi:ATP-binding protein [Terrabacter sp. 2YAF2]|uniref:ATP-binding protein n=1 Tax=Terrabacter sp. 2YAF2 TaxID=3233026 RepID=UPI003F9A465C